MQRLTPIEWRVLQYLDQRGGAARRQDAVIDLAHPDSKIHRVINSSGGHLAMIFGRWTKRLVERGLVKEISDEHGWYVHHELTPGGRCFIRQ